MLAVDEMKIKEDLVYDRHTGEIVGFVNVGGINNDIIETELNKQCESVSNHPPVATHVLVFMVRGIFIKLNFPYAHFPTSNLTAHQQFPIVWEAIQRLEAAGLKIICVTDYVIDETPLPKRKRHSKKWFTVDNNIIFMTV